MDSDTEPGDDAFAPEDDYRYPDSGQMLEDAGVLRNAITFTVAQRAYVADSLLHRPFDGMSENVLAMITLEAFGAEMTSLEDTLGWLFALKDWEPGTAAKCLMANLDTIQVGRGVHDEDAAAELLSVLDGSKLRKILHFPKDDDLRRAGASDELIEALEKALPYKLDGLRRVAERRAEGNRGRVVAFNKLKHMLLGFLVRDDEGKPQVELIKGSGYDSGEIHLNTVTLEVSAANIDIMAGNALAAQASLWDTLALILWSRFGEQHNAPPWVHHAMVHGNWSEGVTL